MLNKNQNFKSNNLSANPNFFIPLFRLPFRVFFLAAIFFSVIAIGFWGLHWFDLVEFKPWGGIYWWHGHEMIFGFASAVLVGFLLTAAKNWTGLPGLAGYKLILLFSFWMLARIAYFFDQAFIGYFALIMESSFWLLACFYFSKMIIYKKMWRNSIFSLVFIGMLALNFASVYAAINGQTVVEYLHTGIFFFVIVITIIGGRIIPLFTASATGVAKMPPIQVIEFSIIGLSISALVWILINGLITQSIIFASLLLLLSGLNLFRLYRWPVRAALSSAMLWSLYLAYCSLIFGVVLIACYHLNVINNLSAAIHLLTIGSIGLMILSMTSRVSLGHTGRKIVSSPELIFAFGLIFLAALIRTIVPLLNMNQWLAHSYALSAFLWVGGFTIWLVKFIPILLAARKDGLSG